MPDYLYSADDQDTAILAIEALIVVTSTDARLQTAYRTWGRGIQDVFEAQRQSHPDVAAGEILLAAMHRDVNGDRDCIAGVIEDELLLPYPWLADMLLVVFQTRLLEEATASNCFDLRFDQPPITIGARLPGETARQFARRVAAADAPPAGRRRPKGGGAH